MNKALHLFDEKFVLELFRREVLPQYPTFVDIRHVVVKPYKKLVWETTYHVVIAYDVFLVKDSGEEIKIPLVCSAHSDEPRENVYLALKYLWASGLNQKGIDLPHPLFYSPEFNGTFYRGLKGENLLYYIKKKDYQAIEEIVKETAHLFACLHSLPVESADNFNPLNARIQTVIPGASHILQEISVRYDNKYSSDLEKIYNFFTTSEEKFFATNRQLVLIHGDAHPENILKTGEERIGLIDFTDFCLGDFARDLGAFSQQLEYKIIRKIGDARYASQMKDLFLSSYFAETGQKMTPGLQARLDLYYNWTAIRTATFWFLKFNHDEARAASLLNQVKENLGL